MDEAYVIKAFNGATVRMIQDPKPEEWLVNTEAQEYLILLRVTEQLKLEYKALRKQNGNSGMPRISRNEVEFRQVILQMEYLVEDAMWRWLETTPD